jgi:DegV family protein with EDD domain
MDRIGIVTDSTAYLSPRFKKEHQVEVVSLTVNFEADSFLEEEMGGDFGGFYERLRKAPHPPTTSQPSVGDFLEAYERAGTRADSIISIHIAEGLSGTVKAARTAAQMLPGLDITVVDSHTTSIGLYMVVEAAVRAIAEGMAKDEVLKIVDYIVEHCMVLFTLDTLEYVRRGGRIGGAAALLGNLLQIKPILFFNPRKNNTIDILDKVRTWGNAVRRIMDEMQKMGPNIRVCAAYAGIEAMGQELVSRVRAIYPHLTPELHQLGPVLGVHGGPGTVGLGFYPLTPTIARLFAVNTVAAARGS